jgi:hypothetical protein
MLFSISPEMSPFCPFFLLSDPENHSSKNMDYFRYLLVSSHDFWVYHTMIATYFPMVDISKLVDSGCYPPSEKLSGSWFQIFLFNHRNEKVKPATSCGFLRSVPVGIDYEIYTLWYTTTDTETDWIRGYAWLDKGFFPGTVPSA